MSEEKITPEQTQEKVAKERKARKELEKSAQRLDKLKIEYVPLNDVKPNDYNPNRQSDHDFELLLRSIEEDGFTQPIIVSKDMTIIDGEHRWRAADALDMKQVPVVKIDMTAEQARISTIRHNKARGEHNIQLEAQVIKELKMLGATDWMQDSLMMDDADVHKMLDEIPDAEIPDFTGPDGTATREDIEKARKKEKEIAEKKGEEERRAEQRDQKYYRLNLIYSGEEGEIVKKVLGEAPNEKLYELAQKHG